MCVNTKNMVFMILLLGVFQVAFSGIVSYNGQMNTSGNRIKGSISNENVQAKGMSFYWSCWGGEEFYNSGAVNALVDDWKVEIVRAAMAVDINDSYIGAFNGYVSNKENQLTKVRAVVDAAIANDIYVIIDFHTHHGEDYLSQALDFFDIMAKEYGSYDNVIFEIYNEPFETPWSTIKTYANSVVSKIRENSDNLIVVGTPTWSQDVDDVIGNTVSGTNIAYTLHFYAGTHGEDLRNTADNALSANLALFLTEWGTVDADGNGSVDTLESDAWMNWADENDISWANWSVQSLDEGSSAFGYNIGVSTTGSDWGNISKMSESGVYVYNQLQAHATTASWRNDGTSSSSVSSSSVSSSSSITPPTGDADEILLNNDFADGTSNWEAEVGAGSFNLSTSSDEYGDYLNVNISDGGIDRWDVKVQQTNITLKKGYKYIMAWGATRNSGSIQVGVGMIEDPYTDRMSDVINFSGSYEEHTVDNGGAVVYEESCDAIYDDTGLRFYIDMGGNDDDVSLAWMSLTEYVCEDQITSVFNPIDNDFKFTSISNKIIQYTMQSNLAYSIAVYDLTGKMITHQYVSEGIQENHLNIPQNTNAGVYFIKVQNNISTYSTRFVVE